MKCLTGIFQENMMDINDPWHACISIPFQQEEYGTRLWIIARLLEELDFKKQLKGELCGYS